jgi:hypothetical protein
VHLDEGTAMSLRIVTFSKTPLAGAPIRIVRALQRHTDLDVRHVDLKRWGIFEHDHVHEEDPERTAELAERADILHLFNYLNAGSNDFAPVDFGRLATGGKRLVRQFGSTPMLIAAEMGIPLEEVLNDPIPKLVIAQHPERFLPTARVVPNIVSQDDELYLPACRPLETAGVVFCPTRQDGAWEARWDTKGMPETVAMMKRLNRRTGLPFRMIHGRPFEEAMAAKRCAAIVIDDLVTGSYHLSSLEGLALAKPVLTHLDGRTDTVLRAISGADSIPFVNVRLEDAPEVLTHLAREPDERHGVGVEGRAWIDRYWRDRDLVRHYVGAYADLMDDPRRITRQPELALDRPARIFRAIALPDCVHQARHRHWLDAQPLDLYFTEITRRLAVKTRRALATNLPETVKAGLRSLRRGRKRAEG